MFGRKREAEAIQVELRAAQQHLERADSITNDVVSRRPWVESLASKIADRRERNGFGDDYQITLSARRG